MDNWKVEHIADDEYRVFIPKDQLKDAVLRINKLSEDVRFTVFEINESDDEIICYIKKEKLK